jgi:hypothetical protein
MIIRQINIERVTVNKAENDAPVARYRDAPQTLEAALERMKAVAR